jgi:hypothetical protein
LCQSGCVVAAIGLLFAGIQGLRGIPDEKGRQTSKGVAVGTIIAAVALAIFGIVILPALIAAL